MRVAAADLGELVALVIKAVRLFGGYFGRGTDRLFNAIEPDAVRSLVQDALDRPLADAAREPGHRMRNDREATLPVNRFQGRREWPQALQRLLDEECKNMTFSRSDFFTKDDFEAEVPLRPSFSCEFGSAQLVVLRHRDDGEIGLVFNVRE